MERKGYKAFDKNMRNRYNIPFEEGKTYSVEGPLKFGNPELGGHGIHFCKRLEDTLRYVPAQEEEVIIAEVTSLGEVAEGEDEYNGFYDMYAARTVRIEKFLLREEIIEMFLNLPSDRVIRFIQLMKLTPGEIARFKERYASDIHILNAIAYYQEDDKNVYERYFKSYNKDKA